MLSTAPISHSRIRYTTVRGILQGLAAADVEKVFRLHAQILNESAACLLGIAGDISASTCTELYSGKWVHTTYSGCG